MHFIAEARGGKLECLQPVVDYYSVIEAEATLPSGFSADGTFYVVVAGEDSTEYGSMQLDVEVSQMPFILSLSCSSF